jgi:hypothetical protein
MVTLVPRQTEASFKSWWHASSLRVQDEQQRKGFNSLVMLGAWIIWKHRNQCVFDGLAPCVSAALLAAREDALLWTVAGARGMSLLQTLQPQGSRYVFRVMSVLVLRVSLIRCKVCCMGDLLSYCFSS